MPDAREWYGEALSRIPLFSSLSAGDRQTLSQHVRHRVFARGEYLLRCGDVGSTLFMLLAGQLKVLRPLPTGEDAVIAILGPGDVVGELALLDGETRSASVVALESAEVLSLRRTDFDQFIRQRPDVVATMLATLSRRIRRQNRQLEARFLDLSQRLARELLELGRQRGIQRHDGLELQLRISQADLASLIGASRPRVNRLLAEWQDRQVIRLGGRGEIILLRQSVLEEIAAEAE